MATQTSARCAPAPRNETIREAGRFVSPMFAQDENAVQNDESQEMQAGEPGSSIDQSAAASGDQPSNAGKGAPVDGPTVEPWSPLSLVISAVGLLLLLGFVGLLIRRPRLLDKKSRPCELTPTAVLPGLIWYFLLLPVVATFFVQIARSRGWLVEATTPADQVEQAAMLQWIGHALTLPVIGLWWWARRWDRWHYAADGHSAIGHGGSGRQKGPRGWGSSISIGFICIIVIWPVIMFVNSLSAWAYSELTGEAVNPVAHQTLVMLENASLDRWTWMIIASVVVASPVFEEIIFRGLLQSAAQSFFRRVIPAVVAASLIFSLRHYGSASPEALPGLFILAVGMGIAYAWTGRIITPIIMHMLYNGANILLLYTVVMNSQTPG